MKMNLQNLSLMIAGVAMLSSVAMTADVKAKSLSSADQATSYNCLYDVCVGDSVKVISGRWIGHGGPVIAVDARSQTITAVNGSNFLIYPSVYDVYVYTPSRVDQCAGNICIGDEVRILGGNYRQIGRVTATDSYRYTATVIIAGRSFNVSVRDLSVVSQAPPSRDPRRAPRPNRQGNGSGRMERRNPNQQGNCPIGTRPNPRVGGRCTAT